MNAAYLRSKLARSRASLLLLTAAYAALAAERSAAEAGKRPDDADRRSAVVARSAAGVITVADIEDAIANKLPSQRAQIAKPGGREQFLARMIDYDLLAQEAARRGYATHPSVHDAVVRARAADAIAARVKIDPAAIPQAEVDAAYAEHRAEFDRPRLRRASHIQVASEAAARALIAELQGADRARFARLAVEQSSDERTQRQGGELGYFDRDGNTESGRPAQIPPALVAATFALQRLPELAPEPIAHDGVWSVLMLTGEMREKVAPRAKVEKELRERLATAKYKAAVDALLAQLREEQKPEVHPELVDAIVLPDTQAPDIPQGFPAAPSDPRAAPQLVAPDED